MKRETVKKANKLLQDIESLEEIVFCILSNEINITTSFPPNGERKIYLSDQENKRVRQFLAEIYKEEISQLEKELEKL